MNTQKYIFQSNDFMFLSVYIFIYIVLVKVKSFAESGVKAE